MSFAKKNTAFSSNETVINNSYQKGLLFVCLIFYDIFYYLNAVNFTHLLISLNLVIIIIIQFINIRLYQILC